MLVLEYFPLHGRAMVLRLLLFYCKVLFKDKFVTREMFVKKKMEGRYPLG